MRVPTTARLVAATAIFSTIPNHVSAFLNTSPFFIITPSEIPQGNVPISASVSTLTTNQFFDIARDIISQCHSDGYVIATQPGVHAKDFRSGHAGTLRVDSSGIGEEDDGTTNTVGVVGMPHLKRALRVVPGNLVVPYARTVHAGDDSLGGDIAVRLGEWARDKCGAELVEVDASTGSFARYGDMKPKVLMVKLGPLDEEDPEERAKALADTDAFLFSLVESFPSNRYTLIYTSTPRTHMDSPSSKPQELHSPPPVALNELRRRASHPFSSALDNDSPNPDATIVIGSLFQRYAFFTPAIFLGYLTFFFLGTIVFVGLYVLLSLKVSYAAFDKEMGPAAAKKQQ